MTLPSIVDATRSYESWLAKRTPLAKSDLRRKHEKMDASPFVFMRATYYRWAQSFGERCADVADAPVVLAVGDLHINNFGMWRDGEGRLAWGINDFDEAYPLPYTNDLVRLALSSALIGDEAKLEVCLEHACESILEGYAEGLRTPGSFVLAERNNWIRELAVQRLAEPRRFWSKLDSLPAAGRDVPASAVSALKALLPRSAMPFRLVRRSAGAGSLGRRRIVALAEWEGGRIAREAKACVPSACVWSDGAANRVYCDVLLRRAIRAHDPWVSVRGGWIVRRLAPDCTRIELDSLPNRERTQAKLLVAMGRETANVHRATASALSRVQADLASRDPRWLQRSARKMLKTIRADWREWKGRR